MENAKECGGSGGGGGLTPGEWVARLLLEVLDAMNLTANAKVLTRHVAAVLAQRDAVADVAEDGTDR
uniref:Uncharacterized protein n=1 Tax=Mycena chlorophos TaxID=658473 RepID=A0ABQ0LAL7_MYCCL|nr:predicted protein [Mycena chlorophos]